MDTVSAALATGDRLVAELKGKAQESSSAPTMGRLKKASYTHQAMIDLIIENPMMSQRELAAHFGYTEGWISNVFAADAFQAAMAARREEIIDPALKATVKERFEALVIRSLQVLQEKLNGHQVSDNVAIRCAELGAKALGVGGHAAPPLRETSQDRLQRLASRLVVLLPPQPHERTIDAESIRIEEPVAATGR